MYDLSGKTVLVTGASKGIGSAIARHCGDAGASVIAHYGGDRCGVADATAAISDTHKLLLSADFADLDAVEALWQEALDWHGHIDVLVNNAATMSFDGGFDQPVDVWDAVWNETLQINVLAPARLLRRAVLHFLERGEGIVITISSWTAQRGVTNPATIAYGASKAAIHNTTKSIARAYADRGILAYMIAPGVVRTRLSEQFAATQGGESQITDTLAMKEWVPPDDIAATVQFLASGRARHLSGATLDINGATYIR